MSDDSQTALNANGVTIGALRKRAYHRCTPHVATDCGIPLPQLDRFLRGQPHSLDRGTLHTLARRLGLHDAANFGSIPARSYGKPE